MRPLNLTLTGFIGVRDGMNRESLTLDFESLPNGLIALSGRIGSGKTTIMDNSHPYRIMPSQATKLSVDSFSYWDHIYGSKAEKVFNWEHAGVRYRSTFSFRKTGKSGKADYYLTAQNAEGLWEPVTLPDGRTSDGKAENYDRCLESVCGSLEQFFTSVFSAQNRRPLSAYGANEIKSLLAELLKVDQLQALHAKACEVYKSLMKRHEAGQQEILRFASKRERLAQITTAHAADSTALEAARLERSAQVSSGEVLTQQRATLAAKQVENATAEARLQELAVRQRDINDAIAANAQEEKVITQRLQERRTAVLKLVTQHQATLAQGPLIQGAAAKREDAQLRISRCETRTGELQKQIQTLENLPVTVKTLEAEINSIAEQGSAHQKVLSTFKGLADDFVHVPCRDLDVHSTCPLYTHAEQAHAKADAVMVDIRALRQQYRAKEKQVKALTPELVKLQDARKELEKVNGELVTARRDLQQATDLAARAPLIEQAKEGLATCQADFEQLEKEAKGAVEKFLATAKQLNDQLQLIAAEVSRLGAVNVAGEIANLDLKAKELRDAVARVDGQIEALIRSQATREVEAEALKVELKGYDATQKRVNFISDEIAKWKLLAKGLGNDGIIALTIDDAGPALTQEVNDLLLACYGRRFTVEIQTQRALASGELREGFEILVHDADNDTTKTIGVMSGGQKVLMNDGLTRGLALYLARTAGQPYQTLFTDEADGPLDPETKRHFFRMKREVLRLGGYEREFFISHTPELLEEADAVIDVAALAQ